MVYVGPARSMSARDTQNRGFEAVAMTDNEKVPTGTRYDALRMLGATDWETNGPKLAGYLGHTHAELQMGAVSGLADIASSASARAMARRTWLPTP